LGISIDLIFFILCLLPIENVVVSNSPLKSHVSIAEFSKGEVKKEFAAWHKWWLMK